MKKHYSEELNHLKEMVLRMGGLVEKMTHDSVRALVERKREMFPEVREMETQVNQLHMDIDEVALGMIALRQPTATGYERRCHIDEGGHGDADRCRLHGARLCVVLGTHDPA